MKAQLSKYFLGESSKINILKYCNDIIGKPTLRKSVTSSAQKPHRQMSPIAPVTPLKKELSVPVKPEQEQVLDFFEGVPKKEKS